MSGLEAIIFFGALGLGFLLGKVTSMGHKDKTFRRLLEYSVQFEGMPIVGEVLYQLKSYVLSDHPVAWSEPVEVYTSAQRALDERDRALVSADRALRSPSKKKIQKSDPSPPSRDDTGVVIVPKLVRRRTRK